jgi:hypothetical protein
MLLCAYGEARLFMSRISATNIGELRSTASEVVINEDLVHITTPLEM